MQQIFIPGGLFPFTKAQVFDYEYGVFQLLNVYGKITEDQRKQCVSMWLQTGVIPTVELAWQRSEQVCYMFIHRPTGQLAGVNTLYSEVDAATGEKWFLNRMFIRPKFRSTRLMIIGTSLMLVFAKTYLAKEGDKGVKNINENKKLHKKSLRKIFTRLGYTFSHAFNEKEVWFFDFDAVEFVSSQ